MGLVWDQGESSTFASELTRNLDVWVSGLTTWKQGIGYLGELVDTGPLAGNAWNTAKTLFIDRIGAIVDSGLSVCTWTRLHLEQYAFYEVPLLDDGGHLDELLLRSAIGQLDDEIYDLTHWGLFPHPGAATMMMSRG